MGAFHLRVFALAIGCTACGLFPSLDNLTAHDASAPLDASDAPSVDDASDGAAPWKTLSLVQVIGSSATPNVSFKTPTTAGTLLVALEDSNNTPSGAGWIGNASPTNGDGIFVWPNNPGGLQTFTISSDNQDVILAEIAGTPTTLSLDFVAASAQKNPSITSATAVGQTPKQNGEIVFAYLNTSSAGTANPTTTGWTPLGTDGDNDFAWFLAASASAPLSLTVDFTPATPGSLMVLALDTP